MDAHVCNDITLRKRTLRFSRLRRTGRHMNATVDRSSAPGRPLALARWLLVVAFLVILMVVVGGITRLTESGLSITEWKPVTGAIPPLTCLLYTSPSPRDRQNSRMPSSA